jgi:hypothetical protein
MSGRGGRGRRGRGSHAGRGPGGGRGNAYNGGRVKTTKVGLCKDLKGNMFDFGSTSAADQMQIKQEKIAQYIGAKYGEDIANELQNKTRIVYSAPAYPSTTMTRHALQIALVRSQQAMMSTARLSRRTLLEGEIALAPGDQSLVMELAKLNQDITQVDFEAAQDVPVELNDQEQINYSNECRNHSRRISTLETHQGQAYSLILGQCTQLIQDKMKQDASWTTVSASYDPLELYKLIERVVLKRIEDQYPFTAVLEQSLAMLNTKQGGLSNMQWYEHINTHHNVAHSVGVELGHKVLWEYCAQLKHSMSYDALGTTNQAAMRQAAEDQYLAYILLINSGGQHDHLRKELQNDFTKGHDKYPEKCSQTLLFLDRYSKLASADSGSQGTAFTHKGGQSKKGKEKKGPNKPKAEKKDFDKEYFKDLPCFKCGKKGHPQSHCPTKTDDDDNSSISSRSSRSSKSGRNPKIMDFENQFKNLKKSFVQLKPAQEGDLDSDSSEEMLHFQYGSRINGGGCLPEALMDMAFKQSKKGLQGFNLRGVILLDNQSTVYIFCNKEFISNI